MSILNATISYARILNREHLNDWMNNCYEPWKPAMYAALTQSGYPESYPAIMVHVTRYVYGSIPEREAVIRFLYRNNHEGILDGDPVRPAPAVVKIAPALNRVVTLED